MKHPLLAAFQIAQPRPDQADQPQTEAELFQARARTLHKGRLGALLKAMIPGRLTARVAARQDARDLQAEIARLERLSPHLLDDIGVVKQGASGYVVSTDEAERAALGKPTTPALPAVVPAPAPAPEVARSLPTGQAMFPASRRRAGVAGFA
jgi:hypothetical protein